MPILSINGPLNKKPNERTPPMMPQPIPKRERDKTPPSVTSPSAPRTVTDVYSAGTSTLCATPSASPLLTFLPVLAIVLSTVA